MTPTADALPSGRWAWADVDLDAIAHNVGVLRAAAAPSALWAVVKADAYGHGAVSVARAVLDAGAAGLCVALVQEAAELRDALIDAPVLVLSEQPPAAAADAVRLGLISTVYSVGQLDALAAAGAHRHRVQVKVNTGMNRVGCAPGEALALAQEIERRDSVVLDGVFTHLAVADEPADPYSAQQLDLFDEVLGTIRAAGIDPGRVHAANSAGALAHPRARHDLVRAGIALYGIQPGRGVEHLCHDLRPALSLHACVSHVKQVHAGDRISYGLRHAFTVDTTVATVPVGYADGVPRRLFETHGHALVRGRRCPIVGVVTMDQLMLDVGDLDIEVGEPVVLIGADGTERIRAEDWAERLGTIGYEIVCGLSKRVSRHHRAERRTVS
ncbi:MAG: alanine racemase [Actinobacteria bacterium]|nr:alanine racemase [Actinomycetota bacterium]